MKTLVTITDEDYWETIIHMTAEQIGVAIKTATYLKMHPEEETLPYHVLKSSKTDASSCLYAQFLKRV